MKNNSVLDEMSWKEDVDRELKRAREAGASGNDGRVRTCARRAVGFALTELQRRDPGMTLGEGFLVQLRGVMENERFPADVRDAARRLQAKIAVDFSSPSVDPLQDAMIILAEVTARIGDTYSGSSER